MLAPRSSRRPSPACSMLLASCGLAILGLSGCASHDAHHSSHHPSHAQASGSSSAVARSDAAPGLKESGPGVERFYRIRTPGAPVQMPDGSLLVRDWPKGVFQIYRIPAKSGGAVARAGEGVLEGAAQLTDFKDGATGFALSPDKNKVLVFTAMGGNERTQVYLLDVNNPNPSTNLTPLLVNPEVIYRVGTWSNDSSAFYYTANDADANNFHVYRYDLATRQSTKLLARDGDWTPADVSRDGTRVVLAQYRSASDADVQLLNTRTGELTLVNRMLIPEGQTAALEPVGFASDENSLLIISDHQEGIKRLYQIDLSSRSVTKPLPALDRYELDGASLNHSRTLLAVASNEDGYGVPHLYRMPGYQPVTLPAIERGVVFLTQLDDDFLSYRLSNARTPGLVFTMPIPAAGEAPKAPRQLTFVDTQGIALERFPLPELVTITSFDGMQIPAFLYLPEGAKKGTPIPFVVDYHGGPEGQYRPDFSAFVQYLLSEGFGVLRPNVRGSSGYGRDFIMADDYKKRWDAVRDGWHAGQWLVQHGYATPGKLATYGGSYGGYMTTAVHVEDTNRLEAGETRQRLFGASINVVGVINFKTFLERTGGYRRKLREVEYGPLSDPEFLDSVSPLVHADKINVPMLLAHGANDPRVPVTEAMQMAEALMRRGWDPEQIYFDDEGHGFAKLENRLLFAKRASRFLKRNIGTDSPAR